MARHSLMVSDSLAPTPQELNPATDCAAETTHLRRLIETQPFCLMRVGLDGTLLAANEAALGLLGARELGQVLGSNVMKWMAKESQDHWHQFSARLADGASSSLECQLTDQTNTSRTVVFQGAPLLEHADGVPSMILGARDISASYRIEDALHAGNSDRLQAAPPRSGSIEVGAQRAKLEALERLLSEGRTHLQNLRTQLQQVTSERDGLSASLGEATCAHQRQMADQEAGHAQLRRTLEEQHERDLSRCKQELEPRVNDLQSKLDAAQHRLADLEAAESAHERQMADQEAGHAQLRKSLAEEHELDLVFKDQEAQQRLNAQQSQLESITADRDRLTGLLAETEAVHRRFVTEISAERAAHDAVLQTAALTQKQMEKELADCHVELQNMDSGLRQLAPLAASGRLALEVGRELWKITEMMDARTAGLLAQSSLEAESRCEIEALRSEALQARLLGGQIPQANADAEPPHDTAIGGPDSRTPLEEHA